MRGNTVLSSKQKDGTIFEKHLKPVMHRQNIGKIAISEFL